MRFGSIIFFVMAFSSLSYGNDKSYPPKSWWDAPQSIEEIEKQNEAWAIKQIEKYKNATFKCVDSEIKTIRGRPFKFDCNSFKGEENPIIESIGAIESMRLSKAKGWAELKSLYKAGDEVRSYAAPPLSGGIGYILVRNGNVIHVYETANQ
ncbi:MAG: hypothetical protein HWE11_07205 [Gammaproteobacteria bacterium]|nr:hypothetical protein [Gammaproteobacteria bacterium]